MAESTQKSSSKANTASAERRPQRPAAQSGEFESSVDALHVLQGRGGNRAVTQTLGGGTPLSPELRAEMEQRFGSDFGDVRVHNDHDAHNSAALMEAKAYTQGRDIVFGADRFSPYSTAGKRLLAHELAHVVQQRRGGATPAIDAHGSHEIGAAQAASAYASGQGAINVSGATGVGVARDGDDDSWTARFHRKVNAIKESIPEKYREPIAKVADVVADNAVSTVLTPFVPPIVTNGLGSSVLHGGEKAATGESGATEDLKGFGRKKAQDVIGGGKAVLTQLTEVADTGLWLGNEYKGARDKAAETIAGKKGSTANTVVTHALDGLATAIPGLGGLPAAAQASDQLKALGLVDPDTKDLDTGEAQASLTAPLTEKLNEAVAWTEQHIGGTPDDPDLFTEVEKAELGTSITLQVALSFTGVEEVKIAMNVVGALSGLRGIVESIRREPNWATSSRFWSSVIGMVLSVVGLKHSLAASKITTLMLKFGWVAAAVPPLTQMVADYLNPDYRESPELSDEENQRRRAILDQKLKQGWVQAVHVLKDAILHISQTQGGKAAARPDNEPPPVVQKNTNTGGSGSSEGGTTQPPANTAPPPIETLTANATKTQPTVAPAQAANEGNATPIKSGVGRAKSAESQKLDNDLAKQSSGKAGSVTSLVGRKGAKPPPSEPQQQQVPVVQEQQQKVAVGQTHGADGGGSSKPLLRAVNSNEPTVGMKQGGGGKSNSVSPSGNTGASSPVAPVKSSGGGRVTEPSPGPLKSKPPAKTAAPVEESAPPKQSKSSKQAARNKRDQQLREQAREDREFDGGQKETDPLQSQKKSRDTARSEDRDDAFQTPPKVAADRARQAQQLYDDARAGKFRDLNPANKRRLVKQFEKLATEAGWSPQKRNPMKGNFDEALRTPAGAPAQPEYKAGGPRIPGQDKANTVRPDYDQVKPDASGVNQRSHVNLKADNIEIKSDTEALSTARRYTKKAVADTKGLPTGARVVIRYGARPVDQFGEHVALEQEMNSIHFRPGSPISEVHYGTVVYRNPAF